MALHTDRENAELKKNCSTEIVQRFRGRLVFKAHGLLYHSTLGLRVIKSREGGYHARALLEGVVVGIPPLVLATQGVG